MGEALIDVREARRRVLAEAAALPSERVEVSAALGRVLAEEIASEGALPPFDASAMDGFATPAGAAEELEVVGESRAGRPASASLARGQAMRISTGAMVPEGAEAVVPVERATLLSRSAGDGAAAERVRVPERKPGDHIRRGGEDVGAGQVLMRPGRRIGPAEIAVLAAVGREAVVCGSVPRVSVLATGDELVAPGPLALGQIRDSNSPALAALAEQAGARVVRRARAGDDAAGTRAALADALEPADVLCVSGGVSVGEHDHVKASLAELAVEECLWGVALKPGKPAWFGARGPKLVFGLPGNPVSAVVTFELFVRPALARLAGVPGPAPRRAVATLDEPVRGHPSREQAVRCRLEQRSDGAHVSPTGRQESHLVTSLLDTDALLLVPAGDGELTAGARVEVELLR